MKKSIIFTVLLAAFILQTWFGCEKHTPEPPSGQSNKYPYFDTLIITAITDSSATFKTRIINHTSLPIESKGLCWSTNPPPLLTDNHINAPRETDSFVIELTGLNEGTAYYVRSYAKNQAGTAYGKEKKFVAGENLKGTFKDPRDGQTYKWVKIGDQIWMAENLNYDQNSYGNDWCYNNNSSNCSRYGRLYNWAAVMQGKASSNSNPSGVQGVCPDGWHVPSDEEWKELERHLGMNEDEVDSVGMRGINEGSMLSGNSDLWDSGGLTNNEAFGASGFTALPAGGRHQKGDFSGLGKMCGWWSSTEKSPEEAWARIVICDSARVFRTSGNTHVGLSVRCVKDN